ncbi:4a-hydroxytetrahydrobiopterin dehydratase family protein [Pandoraea terrae]|nr:4a-hydroxytetrahydrobiopterin dehydratase [Pandoraea terrae]
MGFGWGWATVSWQTKKIKRLHENDFIMAAKTSSRAAWHRRCRRLRNPAPVVRSRTFLYAKFNDGAFTEEIPKSLPPPRIPRQRSLYLKVHRDLPVRHVFNVVRSRSSYFPWAKRVPQTWQYAIVSTLRSSAKRP